MTKINLTAYHREDWHSFLSADDRKRHWIKQRLLEDERDMEETEAPPIPKYVKPERVKLSAKERIMQGYKFLAP